jgi:hypothetical protein
MKKMLVLVIVALCLSNCAVFDKNLENSNRLNKSDFNKINGQYHITEIGFDSINKVHHSQMWTSTNFLTEIDRKLLKDTLKIDSTKHYKFELEMISKKKLKITYFENDVIFRERILKTKLRKDGYLYLKNKNIGFVLVPYIFGALDVKKTRLTVAQDGSLVFDSYNHRSGAVFVVGFLNGRTWRSRSSYQKINALP